MFLPNVPGATFIPGATSIPESRVQVKRTPRNDFLRNVGDIVDQHQHS